MTANLRVQVEQPTRDKKWVAVAVDWPGLERGATSEQKALDKLTAYLPRYLTVAKRARLGKEFAQQTDIEVVEHYTGTGSTDFWGISFAPSSLDRLPYDERVFARSVRLLRAAWAEFDDTAAAVSAELRPGPRGGGRSRDRIVDHVLNVECQDFAARVGVPAELEAVRPPAARPTYRDRFVTAMRDWYAAGEPLGKWTVPYLLRHAAYHALDHAWEMQDRDLTGA
jgi:hypothetical protein